MKVSNISLALALLLGSSLANAESEETRELAMNAKKAARIAARKAKKAAKKAMEPEKGMYFDLVYVEKMCGDPVETADIESIGNIITFNCELYQKAINYGTYGADKVGDTYWNCGVIAETEDEEGEPLSVLDCTITDYIGGGIGGTYIRSEGLSTDFQDPVNPFPFPHSGNFATVGGINEAKGIRGQLDVVYDDYKMTWFHIYHVEAWSMGPQPDYW